MVEATCSKCEDPFTDPRILPCLHSFCLKCLQKLSESTLQCPECDEEVPLPSSGVQAFPKDHCSAHEAKIAILKQKLNMEKKNVNGIGEQTVMKPLHSVFSAVNFSVRDVEMTTLSHVGHRTMKFIQLVNDRVK